MPFSPCAVIRHSQPGRQAAYEWTPAWWLEQLSHPSNLDPLPRGSLPAAGGQWEEPGHYQVWMDWSFYYQQPLKPSLSFIFQLHVLFLDSKVELRRRVRSIWIFLEVEGWKWKARLTQPFTMEGLFSRFCTNKSRASASTTCMLFYLCNQSS